MSDEINERLTAALVAHEYALEMKRGSICLCGFVPTVQPETLQTQQDYHRAHLAAALRPTVDALLAEARRQVALDMADDLRPLFQNLHGEVGGLSRAADAVARKHVRAARQQSAALATEARP